MKWFSRAMLHRTPQQQAADRVADLLLQLMAEHDFMIEQGWQFLPEAKLARRALQAIGWLR